MLTLLTPTSDESLDEQSVDEAIETLAGPGPPGRSDLPFQFWAGLAGERGAIHEARDEPFRTTFPILGDPFSIRFESWLPIDTFRRAGFGHVLRGRDSVLTVERGVSLVSFQPDGSAIVAYAAGLYAPKPRLRRLPATFPAEN